MDKGRGNLLKAVILIVVIILALALVFKRTFLRPEQGPALTPEQKAEQERWLNMTPEEKEAETRKEMQEMGVSAEEIERLMRQQEEVRQQEEMRK